MVSVRQRLPLGPAGAGHTGEFMDRGRLRAVARTGAVVVSIAAAALVGFGVSAHERAESVLDAVVARLAPMVALDLSELGLKRYASRMDPGAAAIRA